MHRKVDRDHFWLDYTKWAFLDRSVFTSSMMLSLLCVPRASGPLPKTLHAFRYSSSDYPGQGGDILILKKMKPGPKVRYESEPGLEATSVSCPQIILLFLLIVTSLGHCHEGRERNLDRALGELQLVLMINKPLLEWIYLL